MDRTAKRGQYTCHNMQLGEFEVAIYESDVVGELGKRLLDETLKTFDGWRLRKTIGEKEFALRRHGRLGRV